MGFVDVPTSDCSSQEWSPRCHHETELTYDPLDKLRLNSLESINSGR